MISITESAAKKVGELIKAESTPEGAEMALRVEVRPGGCSGNNYEMFFDSKISSDDKKVNHGDVVVVVDSASAPLLKGATLDYKDGLDAGFSIENPSAQHTCGCGKSFR